MEDFRSSDNLIDGKSKESVRAIAKQPIFLHWVLWFIPYLSIVTSILSGVFVRSWKPWLFGNLVALVFGFIGGASGDPSYFYLGTLVGSAVGAGLTHTQILNYREALDNLRNQSSYSNESRKNNQIYELEQKMKMNKSTRERKDLSIKSSELDFKKKKFNPRKKQNNLIVNLDDFQFGTALDANADEVYKALKDLFYSTEEGSKVFEMLRIDSYEIVESTLGGIEFVTYDDLENDLLILTSERKKTKTIWTYSSLEILT